MTTPTSSWAPPYNFPFPRPPEVEERGGVDAEDHAALRATRDAAVQAWNRDEVRALVDAAIADARVKWERELVERLSATQYNQTIAYANQRYTASVEARETDEEGDAVTASGWRRFAIGGAIGAVACALMVFVCKT
jgi:hypothetical protein